MISRDFLKFLIKNIDKYFLCVNIKNIWGVF